MKWPSFSSYCTIGLISTIFITLFIVSVAAFFWQTRHYRQRLIFTHLKQLEAIFHDINDSAGITSFEHFKNHVDFLNVKKFKGSTLGSMNLERPEKWKGPYAIKSPTVQEQYYQIVYSNERYFIMPGDGVTLPNGKVMGEDVQLTSSSDISVLCSDPQQLNYKGQPLAIEIPTINNRIQRTNSAMGDPYELLT